MMPQFNMLAKLLVKPFYRENAGLFLFLLTVMFGVVGELNGADMIEYHYALIRGFIGNASFLFLVLLAWGVYAQKGLRFVSKSFRRPEYAFLYNLGLLRAAALYGQLLLVQLLIFLPVLLYALVAAVVAIHRHAYLPAVVILLYSLLLCGASAAWYLYELKHPGRQPSPSFFRRFAPLIRWNSYGSLLVRAILSNQKLLLSGFVLYTCGMLILIVVNLKGTDYDFRLAYVMFMFGILGHGVILYQLREWEEQYQGFYRGLPVPVLRRFGVYAGVCFCILLPEFITIACLTPWFIPFGDAVSLVLSGYSVLLFLYAILFVEHYTMLDYLKLCFLLLFVLYMALLAHLHPCIPLLFASLSAVLFLRGYDQYERIRENGPVQ